jgi:hypothetical protein
VGEAEILERLDTIIALLNLAHAEPIGRARRELLGDPVAAAVLDTLFEGPLSAGELKQRVMTATKQSERTVLRRLATLVSQRVIQQLGSGSRTSYRATGLFGGAQRKAGPSGAIPASSPDD